MANGAKRKVATKRPASRQNSEPQGLRTVVADRIRQAIMRGSFKPGSPLGEVELAEKFGVSRGPVREALVQLEREYLVRSYPNRGRFVTTLSEQEFDEILRLRSVLEPIAMENARLRVTPQLLKSLQAMVDKLNLLAARGDLSEFIEKDFQFHLAIWEASEQTLLKEILIHIARPMFIYASVVQDRYQRAGFDLEEVGRTHQRMFDFVAGKTDADASSCLQPMLDITMRDEKPIMLGLRR